jgi:hypothetical protein
LSCQKARPITLLSNKIKHCLLPKWQPYSSSSMHEIEMKFLLKEGT